MSSVSSLFSTNNTSTSNGSAVDRFQELDTQAFLKMMIAELQSQDPLNPMDNSKMLEQISQIRSITSNDALTNSVNAMRLGQSMATAAGLLGKTVIGLDVVGQETVGVVDKVAFEDGKPYLFVGNTIIELDNIYGMAETPTAVSANPGNTDNTGNSNQTNDTDESNESDIPGGVDDSDET
jgi:flagellar basal-body rod modification protein FlgD